MCERGCLRAVELVQALAAPRGPSYSSGTCPRRSALLCRTPQPSPHDGHWPHTLCPPCCPSSTSSPLPTASVWAVPAWTILAWTAPLQGSPLTPVTPFKSHLPGTASRPTPHPTPLSFCPHDTSPPWTPRALITSSSASTRPTGAPGGEESVSDLPTAHRAHPDPGHACHTHSASSRCARGGWMEPSHERAASRGILASLPHFPRSGATLLAGPGPRPPRAPLAVTGREVAPRG